MHDYNAKWVADYFDEFGEREWERLTKTPGDVIKLHVHSHYLQKLIRPGMKVLDIGAGAGRFTQILVDLGAKVTVADISPEQLNLNVKYARDFGFDHGVTNRILCDLRDLWQIQSSFFDAVVCYGGPISYLFNQREKGTKELLRVAKPAAPILLSVMSLWGSAHEHLDGVLELPPDENRLVLETGDLCPSTMSSSLHHFHMFRSAELRSFLEECGANILEMSASNCLSTVWKDRLPDARKEPAKWKELLRMEVEACREPGALDMGSHIIAVIQRRK